MTGPAAFERLFRPVIAALWGSGSRRRARLAGRRLRGHRSRRSGQRLAGTGRRALEPQGDLLIARVRFFVSIQPRQISLSEASVSCSRGLRAARHCRRLGRLRGGVC